MTSLKLKDLDMLPSQAALGELPAGKLLINTINAHSYNTAQKDALFAEALIEGDVLIPDGASIVKACRWIGAKCQPTERCAGWDLFAFEMARVAANAKVANGGEGKKQRPIVMFLGSSKRVLELITQKVASDYPMLKVVTYSPPYKPEFSAEDSRAMVEAINQAQPDLLWIGMTAPKQEKWTYEHWKELDINCHVGTIGAVFDFYAGTMERAPLWWQEHSLEWFYRLLKEPRRMWRRYIIGNTLFLGYILKERFI